MKFEFATATRIIFGPGTIRDVAPEAAKMGKHAFLITGRSPERARLLLEQLNAHQIQCVAFNVPSEPTTTIVSEAVDQARLSKSDFVIGIGGGSVLDTGKAIAAMLTNSGRLLDYLEVVGAGHPITKIPAPYIAIPTTAGTGAEVTRNAVIAVPEKQVKVSMRSPLLLPRLAIVDPELTHSMSPSITASTGLDALTQLIEAYISNKANPLTDGICREGLKLAARSLRKAYENGSNPDARQDMSLASLFSGLALANARLGAVHGFAGPLGGMIFAPHGVICARLLPFVCEANVKALHSREPDSPVLERFDEIAQIVTGKASSQAADGVEWIQNLCKALTVPPLTQFGLKEQDFPTVVAKAQKSSSMRGNPIPLTDEELIQILINSQ